MNKYLTAIIGVLVGTIGVLIGMFTSTNNKRKEAEEKANELNKTLEVTNEINNIVNKPSETKPLKKKQSGTLGKLVILFSLFIFTSCAYYEPVCPNLVIINKPDFKDINYTYKETIGYVFLDEDMEELYKQFNWAKETISKYEEQIKTYNKFVNGDK